MIRSAMLAFSIVSVLFSANVKAAPGGFPTHSAGGALDSSVAKFDSQIPPPLSVENVEDSLSSYAVSAALSQLRGGGEFKLRGAKEARLYKAISQSVVLVVTKDGLGSGSLISTDGEVITNWHVIRGFTEVGVIFKPQVEGKEFSEADVRRARVVMFDEVRDLALLKVTEIPKGPKPVVLGSMGDISVGNDVHAIGHPTGEAWTYTKGVVSQVRRDYKWTSESQKQHRATVIQTQTPINPGNSGGPLLSDDGKLVGVNSFKSAGEGLNFAVSVQDVIAFLGSTSNRIAADVPNKKPKAQAASCPEKHVELYAGTNSKKNAKVWGYDTNCDGKPDYEVRVPLDETEPVSIVFDRNGDGNADLEIYDVGRDQKFDFSFHDVDYDGKWDLVGYHPDGDIVASRFEKYDTAVAKAGR